MKNSFAKNPYRNLLILFCTILFVPFLLNAANSDPLEQIDFAYGLFERGMYDMSIAEFKKFIEVFPKSELLHEAYFGMAESYYFLKNYDQAINAYDDYLNMFPQEKNYFFSQARIGQSLYFQKYFKEAIAQLSALSKETLEDATQQIVNFYLAKCYLEEKDTQNAKKYLIQLLSSTEKSNFIFYGLIDLGEIYLGEKQYDKALESFEKAVDLAENEEFASLALYSKGQAQFLLKNFGESAYTFKTVLEKYPDSDLVPESLANLLLSLYNLDEYEDLLREYSEQSKFMKKEDAFFDVYLVVASAHDKLGQYNESLAILDEILGANWVSAENLHQASLKKVEILLHKHSFQTALAALNSNLIDPEKEQDKVLFLKGEAYFGLGEFEEARIYYEKIVSNYGDSQFLPDALNGLAYSQQALGRSEEAINFFKKYFDQIQEQDKKEAALYNIIMLYKKVGSFQEAADQCDLFLSTFENSPMRNKILSLLGSFYTKLERNKKAVEFYQQLLENGQDPERLQETYFMLGYNFQMQKEYDQALEEYKKVEEFDEKNDIYASALKNSALIYANIGKLEKTAEYYDRIITELEGRNLEADVYLWLIKFYLDHSDFDDAMRVIEAVKGQDKVKDKKRDFLYFKAEALKGKNNFADATTIYDMIIAEKLEDVFAPAAKIGKGLCLLGLENFADAKAVFENVLLEYPDDHTFALRSRMELARIEMALGNLEEASKLYMMVAILYDDNSYCPEALFEAGKIFMDLNRRQEAKKAFREIITRYKESKYFKDAQDKLKGLENET